MQNGLLLVLLALFEIELGFSIMYCERPILENGLASIQKLDKLTTFNFKCNRSYELIGESNVSCSETEWTYPVPICAKAGCSTPNAPKNGFVTTYNNNNTVYVYCKDRFTLAGHWKAYCNGTHWNRPLGACFSKARIPRSCDFETDMCGWTNGDWVQDQWIRGYPKISAAAPMFDHSRANNGHFLWIHWNEGLFSAQILSPVYPAELSKDACFQFWYWMFGYGTCSLELYVQTRPDERLLIGNNLNNYLKWTSATFRVPDLDRNFQFQFRVIELTSEWGGYAIDDIKLMTGSECSPAQDELVHPARTCELPILDNGVVSVQHLDEFLPVRFKCNPSYVLMGSNYSICSFKKWFPPIPICAKSGCLSNLENADVILDNNGQTATVKCKHGYTLIGQRTAFCNGTNWNPLLGTCMDNTSVPLSCDFETENICGWTSLFLQEFVAEELKQYWIRSSSTNAFRSINYPPHDHTTMQAHGHFMLLEWNGIDSITDATMMSPVYPADLSKDACIQIWHYFYGVWVPYFEVYVKPESVHWNNRGYGMYQLRSLTKGMYVRFTSKVWEKELFSLPVLDENFQIVITAPGTRSSKGGIAIDDFKLMRRSDCSPKKDSAVMDIAKKMPLSCDFETENICGWTSRLPNKGQHYWIRSSSTNASRSSNYPTHDHTTMQAHGHFMLIEWDDIDIDSYEATMMSPLYPADLSKDACFQIWHYTYTERVPDFDVYVQPIHWNQIGMYQLLNVPDGRVTHLTSNVWEMKLYSLPVLDKNFQIVIIGSLSGEGGIAIDDFKLMWGSDCSPKKDSTVMDIPMEDVTTEIYEETTPNTPKTRSTAEVETTTYDTTMKTNPESLLDTTTPAQRENEPDLMLVVFVCLVFLALLLILGAIVLRHCRSRLDAEDSHFNMSVRALKVDSEWAVAIERSA